MPLVAEMAVPTVLQLPPGSGCGIACGAHLKSSLCVVQPREAHLSQTLPNLDHPAAREALHETAQQMLDRLPFPAQWVAHDLHPDYYSSRFAAQLAMRLGVPALAVQHHHAHIAALCAEHGVDAAVLGLALDGVGLGDDGTAWGGELLLVEGARYRRLGHLAPLALAGGDRAAREPWRMAAAALHRMGRGSEIAHRFVAQPGAAQLPALLARGHHSPLTSSAGRWFDAAAGLLGICAVQHGEAEAAQRLQALAERHGPVAAQADGWRLDGAELDFLPLLGTLADCGDAGYGAALFHATFAQGLAHWLAQAAQQHELSTVALAGGCLANRVLAAALQTQLQAAGLRVLRAQRIPPHDGSIALGQAWVARKHFEEQR